MIFSYRGASLQNSLSWGIRWHTKTLTGRMTLKTTMPENKELAWEDNRGKAAGVTFFFFSFSFLTTLKCYRLVRLLGFLILAY